MCMIDLDDGYGVNLEPTHPRARKQHKCDECGRTIEPGETYRRAAGIYEGDFWDSKMCAHCEVLATWLGRQCRGFLYNAVVQDFVEHWDEYSDLHALDMGRCVVGAKQKWRRRDGTLLPIPAVPARTHHEATR